jgi:hypothetical protein
MRITKDGRIGINEEVPLDILHITMDEDAQTTIVVDNVSEGTAAAACLRVRSSVTDGTGGLFMALGTDFITAGGFKQLGVAIVAEAMSTGGMDIMTRAAAPITLRTSGHTDAYISQVISPAGEVTTPRQPAFQGAGLQVNITNMVSTVTNWLQFTEVKDVSNDYAGYTFTCPVDGWYQIDLSVNLSAWDTGTTYYRLNITTSNDSILTLYGGSLYAASAGYCQIASSVCAYCDADDSITMWVRQDGGASQTDVYNSASYTWVSIRLTG